MAEASKTTRRRRLGHAVIEVSLMAPWIFFLFVGVFDMGFYAVALICTQNAARAAVAYTASSQATSADAIGACGYALTELNAMPNVRSLGSCNAAPLTVTATYLSQGVDQAPASQVTVAYQTPNLIPMPVPGLAAQFTITRTAQQRVKSALP